MLIDWVCFVFFGFWVWIKKQRNKGDVLQLNAGTRLLFDYLLTSFSGWNPSGRGKNRTVLRFVPVRWSCVHSTKFQLRLKKKNSQPTSESRHERNDVINGKPLKNTQAEDEKVCCSRNLDQGLVRGKEVLGSGLGSCSFFVLARVWFKRSGSTGLFVWSVCLVWRFR